MAEEQSQRDRVRALVKEVLANTPVEGEDEPAPSFPQHVKVNSLKDQPTADYDRDESAKNLITEDELRGLEAGMRLRVADGVRFTPLASDLVREKGIVLVKKESKRSSSKARSVAIGADHGGFQMKEDLKDFLAGLGVQVRDFGTNSTDAVDYPDYAHAVAKAVADKVADVGIIIDGAGIGSAMTANKVPGVRAAACYTVALAKNSREHNGANVLTLGCGQNNLAEVKEIITTFLGTELTEDRHKKRVAKIDNIEKQYKR
ncbi:MAG TPA: ribose 5-phosphate isomerase B [Pyrinomonadaceae bacterium]|jgi:ribose 5-phosphate isomerase B|nr:ribose 5-phosphate isomerase B [Pyrinomonadaceae bacterium]